MNRFALEVAANSAYSLLSRVPTPHKWYTTNSLSGALKAMKTTAARLSVLAIAFAGFTATTFAAQAHKISAPTRTVGIVCMPVPNCTWNDTTGCQR